MDEVAFAICSITNRKKGYIPGQLIFGRDMILLVKYRVDWGLIRQQKKTQINRDNSRKNRHRFDYDYKVRDKSMLNNYLEYKYETPYKGPFVITQCFTKICRIKPYKSDTKVEGFNSINISDDFNM